MKQKLKLSNHECEIENLKEEVSNLKVSNARLISEKKGTDDKNDIANQKLLDSDNMRLAIESQFENMTIEIENLMEQCQIKEDRIEKLEQILADQMTKIKLIDDRLHLSYEQQQKDKYEKEQRELRLSQQNEACKNFFEKNRDLEASITGISSQYELLKKDFQEHKIVAENFKIQMRDKTHLMEENQARLERDLK